MDMNQKIALMYANSMKIFAGKDKEIIYGEWKKWKAACEASGMLLAPNEFKAK